MALAILVLSHRHAQLSLACLAKPISNSNIAIGDAMNGKNACLATAGTA